MKTVVCVRQGNKYGPEWVSMLWRMVHQNVTEPIRFVCLSDGQNPCETRRLSWPWTGWWSKLELFSPWNADLRPCLYIDLDSFVLGDITSALDTDEFKMAENYGTRGTPQSCVMMIPAYTGHIWQHWVESPDTHMNNNKRHGDQGYLAQFNEGFVNDHIEVLSYKKHKILDAPSTQIVQFHGKPKPNAENVADWVKEVWNEYARVD